MSIREKNCYMGSVTAITLQISNANYITDPNYIADIKCKVCDKETHFLRWKNGTDGNGYDCNSCVRV